MPASVVAAASFGLAGVMQYRATRRVPWQGPARPRLLVDLARQPLWMASMAAMLVGISAQVVALSYAPLVLVQPMLVTGLLFAVVFGAALQRQRPDRVLLAGAGCCVVGLAAFLLAARPSRGEGQLTLTEVVPLAAGLAFALGACITLALRFTGLPRSLALALATGVLYGVTAGLIKVVARDLERGLTEPFQGWALYIVCVIGPLGFLLNQSAFQAGAIVAPALAVIITTDPLVSIGIGLLWLGEQIDASAFAVLAEVLALGVMAGGIAALAHRAPHVRGGFDEAAPG
ncbi:MAG: hypothetical protein GEV03_08435 [Streptosporangiales bacterium]|nr:hypothetical protein [Streptosporangiales bacterium]